MTTGGGGVIRSTFRNAAYRRTGSVPRAAVRAIFMAMLVWTTQLCAQDSTGVPADIAKLSGKEIYVQFCSTCHAEDGSGRIPQEMIDGMEAPPPDFRDGYFASTERRKDWETVVSEGGGARGLSMAMPAWGEVLTPRQIGEVVDYVKGFVDQSLYPQGETNFIRTHTVTKAFVEQEVLIIPTLTSDAAGSSSEFLLYYANRLGTRSQFEVKMPVTYVTTKSSSVAGLGDVELGFKHCFFDDGRRAQIFSAEVEAILPTGNRTLGLSEEEFVYTIALAGGMTAGEMVQLQASAEAEGAAQDLFTSPVLSAAVAATFLPTSDKQGFFPGVELRIERDPILKRATTTILPSLYWSPLKRGHLSFSIAPEIHLAGPKIFDTRWRMFLLWDYADGGLWW